jgi:hypothetical protein
VVITLAYFAVADLLYVARLASYLAIAEPERASSPQPTPLAAPVSPAASAPGSGEVAGPVSS